MIFGILGYGYVGKATHKGLLKDQKAIVYDSMFDIEKSILYKIVQHIFFQILRIFSCEIKV